LAITIFGRGYPLSAVDDGSTLSLSYNGTAILDITSSGLSGTITSLGSTVTTTTVKATTVTGSTVSGDTVSASTVKAVTVTGTTVSGDTVSANVLKFVNGSFTTSLSSGVTTSGGKTDLCFTTSAAGKAWNGVNGLHGTTLCADYMIRFYNPGGVAMYVPAFSAIASA
jgi:hypothetical protein